MPDWFAQHGTWLIGGFAAGLLVGGLVAIHILGRRLNRIRANAEAARAELIESESRYRLLAENASDVIWTLSLPDLSYSYVSPSVTRLRGVPVEQVMQETFLESLADGDRARVERLIRKRIRAFESGRFEESEAQRVEVRQHHADGREITVEIIASLVVDDDGKVTGIQGISRNVTARVQAENERKAREAILHGLARAARLLFSAEDKDVVMDSALEVLGDSVGVDRVYVFENHRHPETGKLLSSQRYEWCGRGITPEIDNPAMQNMDYEEVLPNWKEILESGEAVHGLVEEMQDAERTLLEPQDIRSIVVVPIFLDGQFWGQIGFDDCTRRRRWSQAEIDALEVAAGTIGGAIRSMRSEEELRRLASTDSLTGVGTRREFLKQARAMYQQARKTSTPFALMIMDLDHFKTINDRHGHPVGDQALKMFADICRQTLRTDDLIGRTGGEEFAVVLPGADRHHALRLAEQLRSRVEQTQVAVGSSRFTLSVSIGVAELEADVRDFKDLLKRADDALYAAKRGGRNRVKMAAQS